MKCIRKNKALINIFCEMQIIIWSFSMLMSFLYTGRLIDGVLFAVYQIVAIILPGAAIVRLFNFSVKTDIEWIGLGYFWGYVYSLLIYFFIVPFQLQKFIIPLILVVAFVSLGFILLKDSDLVFDIVIDKKGRIICFSFLLISFIIEALVYTGNNLIPPVVEKNILYNDVLYWIGNTTELMREYPSRNFRDYFSYYNYHYFSSIQLAVSSLFTGIKPIVMGFAFSFLQSFILIIFGAYLFLKKCTNSYYVIVWGLFSIIYSTGLESYAAVNYVAHLFLGQFGFDYGLGAFLFALYYLLLYYETEEYDWRLSVILSILVGVVLGLKAPFGSILILVICALCFIDLFKKKCKRSIQTGGGALIVFGIVYYFVVNIKGVGIEAISEEYRPIYYQIDWLHLIHDKMIGVTQFPILQHLMEIVFSFFYCILANPIIFFWIGLIIIIKFGKRKWNILDSILFLAIAVGTWITIYVGMAGGSNMYFYMAIMPLQVLFVVYNSNLLPINRLVKVLGVASVVFSLYNWVNANGSWVMAYSIKSGMLSYLDKGDFDIDPENRSYINLWQYEAYEKIRDYTKKDELLISNRESLFGGDYTVGVFTERYVILNEIRTAFFNATDTQEQKKYINELKKQGIDYVVYDKNVGIKCGWLEDILDKKYENEQVVLYILE